MQAEVLSRPLCGFNIEYWINAQGKSLAAALTPSDIMQFFFSTSQSFILSTQKTEY